MKKKVDVRSEIKLDLKEEEFFIDRLANLLLMQVEQEEIDKEKATQQAQ